MIKYSFIVLILFSSSFLGTLAEEESNGTLDALETEEAPTRIPYAKNTNYYSKEWRNIHNRPGYKAYDQRVFNAFWIMMGLATLWSTSCYCYRRKFPKNRGMEYSRFDNKYKREHYVDEIIRNQTNEKPKTKTVEPKFDNIAIEKEKLDKSIARLHSIIDVENPRY